MFTENSNTTQNTFNTQPTTADIEFYFGNNAADIAGTCTHTDSPINSVSNSTSSYYSGNIVYAQVTDKDQDTNSATRQTITVTISSTDANGAPIDSETLIATESTNDSGIFIAAVPSTLTSTPTNSCLLSTQPNSQLTARYVDERNADNNNLNIVTADTALVDPFGTVFDSGSGAPINGAVVTIYNANADGSKGSLATVYQNSSATVTWPNEVTTGSPITDGANNIYNLGDGQYWFPFIEPGDYIIEVVTDNNYRAGASNADPTALAANAATSTYTVVSDASYELSFTVPPNSPPIRIDIPKDHLSEIGNGLVVVKTTSSDFVGIGELVEYTLTVDVQERQGASLDVKLFDTLPRGLRFVPNSARSNDINNFQQPTLSNSGRTLIFDVGAVLPDTPLTLTYLAKVGVNSLPGTAINTVYAQDRDGERSSNARAAIQIKDDLYQYTNQIIGQINVDSCAAPHLYSLQIVPSSITNNIVSYQVNLHNINAKKQAHLALTLGSDLSMLSDSAILNGKKTAITSNNNHWRLTLPASDTEHSVLTFKARINDNANDINARVTADFVTANNAEQQLQHATNIDTLNHQHNAYKSNHIVLNIKQDQTFLEQSTIELIDRYHHNLYSKYDIQKIDAYIYNDTKDPSHIARIATILSTLSLPKKANVSVLAEHKASKSTIHPREQVKLRFLLRDKRLSTNFKIPETVSAPSVLSGNLSNNSRKQSHAKQLHDIDFSGVRIMLENGRYAITDKLGKFHFDDVSKGTHIVQLDTYSLPSNVEVVPCVKNSRFAGRSFSRFVDLQGGSLWRTDFYVRKTGPSIGNEDTATEQPSNTHEQEENVAPIGDNNTYSKAWLDQQPTALVIHEPQQDYANLGFIRIIVQHPTAQTLSVLLNGDPINTANFSNLVRSSKSNSSLITWSGVHIKDGRNIISAILLDAKGNEIKRVEKTVSFTNEIKDVALIEEKSTLIADGRTPPVIAVRFTSGSGQPIHKDLTGSFDVKAPYAAYIENQQKLKNNLIIDRDIQAKFTTEENGIAYIKLQPTTQSGKVSLSFKIDGREKVIETWLKPQLRDWIMVGLAEGSIVDSKIKSHMENLSDSELKESYQKDGRIAFFAKGKIKAQWLLTIAYDTDKESKRRIQNENIDPDLYFTLYGDDSQQYQDGNSSKKLYLKIENHLMYALFGDFASNLNATELAKYTRSFTGLKSEGNLKNIQYSAFVAKEDSTFQRDEIAANGTSGPFTLKQNDILINSEVITLETRDRSNQSIVLDTQTLRRHIDYEIDYYTGRLSFKNIVPNTDINFNPVFIVMEYELNSYAEGETSYGGRVAYTTDNKQVEAGITYVSQDAVNAKGQLAAVDITITPNEQNEITFEAAKTNNVLSGKDDGAEAYLLKHKYITADLSIDSRLSRHQADFGLGQQSSSASDIQQANIKAKKKFNNRIYVIAEADMQENISNNDNQHSISSLLNYRYGNGHLEFGYERLNKEVQNTDNTYDIIKLGAQHRFNKVNTYARAELALNGDTSNDKRIVAGLDYDLTNNFSLFTKSEMTNLSDDTVYRHQAGVKISPWSGGEFSSALNRETENGLSQDYANYAFTQRYALSKQNSVDFSYEKGQSISQESSPFNGLNANAISPQDDYTSMSLGFHMHQDDWSLQQRVEHRRSDAENRYGFLNRWYRKEKNGVGFGLRTQAFRIRETADDSTTNSAESELSYIYRPYQTRWTFMDRLKLSYENKNSNIQSRKTRKAVNHFRANFIPNDRNQLSLAYGIKHLLQDFQEVSEDNTFHFAATEYRHDLNEDWDIGLRTSMLYDQDAQDYKYSSGLSLGYSFTTNAWLSLGYNFTGFNDEDFDELDNSNKGWRLDMRIKLDQDTFKSKKK